MERDVITEAKEAVCLRVVNGQSLVTRNFAKEAVELEANKARQRNEDIQKQIESERCSISPLPRWATQPFHADRTVECNPIFVVSTYKGDVFSNQFTLYHPETREPVVRTVTVGQCDKSARPRGVLNPAHQEFFYKLLMLWDQQRDERGLRLDGSLGVIQATAYDFVKYICRNDSASRYGRTKALLDDLSVIPIHIQNEYTWQGLTDESTFRLVHGYEWHVRGFDRKTLRPRPGGMSNVTIHFSKVITDSFLQGNVKQLLWRPYASLVGNGRRPEVAQLLYPMLDRELSTKERYHIKLESLAKRFGLAHYKYKSKRVRDFDSAVKRLHGELIHMEKHRLHLKLVESVDGQDYVLEARRVPCQLYFQGM